MNQAAATVSELYTYPVKSCGAISHQTLQAGNRGLAGDRCWMLVDDKGQFITARKHGHLLQVEISETPRGITVSAPGMETVSIPRPAGGAAVRVRVWKDNVDAVDAGDRAAVWFSDYLRQPCRLVHCGDELDRPVNAARARDGDKINFADSCPLLLIGDASLMELNQQLGQTAEMARFRPNLVLQGSLPYQEDRWRRIRIGSVELAFAKRCKRCILTTLDPESGERHPQREPLASLSRLRPHPDGGALFGALYIPRTGGSISIGEPLEILQ